MDREGSYQGWRQGGLAGLDLLRAEWDPAALGFDGNGFTDEALRKDFSWKFTPLIAEWEHGDLEDELVEVSHEQAEKIIGYFRERWGPYGQPLDS
jgi:hypothetical protein